MPTTARWCSPRRCTASGSSIRRPDGLRLHRAGRLNRHGSLIHPGRRLRPAGSSGLQHQYQGHYAGRPANETLVSFRKTSRPRSRSGTRVAATKHVLVRDSQDRDGPVLQFSMQAWQKFTGQVKRLLTTNLFFAAVPAG